MSVYEKNLDKNKANFVPLTPLTFLKRAKDMALSVTKALGGNGIWGVEFFIGKAGVYFSELSPEIDPNNAGINFAQALPGTPLYEYARRSGLIGPTIDDEENYLLQISDRDARDGETNINFTDYPKLLLESWHFEIQIKTRNAYIQKWGIESYN